MHHFNALLMTLKITHRIQFEACPWEIIWLFVWLVNLRFCCLVEVLVAIHYTPQRIIFLLSLIKKWIWTNIWLIAPISIYIALYGKSSKWIWFFVHYDCYKRIINTPIVNAEYLHTYYSAYYTNKYIEYS